MGFSLLAPLFLLGLAAVAAPILVHLTQRDHSDSVKFPSLRFLQAQPYPHESRRRIRNWPLFLIRLAIVCLLALAFARPLLTGGPLAGDVTAGSRDVVILLDRSASMAYGSSWEDALKAARDRIGRVVPGEMVSLIVFDTRARVVVERSADPGEALASLASTIPGALATSFAPAIQAASAVLAKSNSGNREVVLISDFQSRGWDRASGVKLPPAVSLTTVAVGDDSPAEDVLVQAVEPAFQRDGARGTVSLTTRLANRKSEPVSGLRVSLIVDGREMASSSADIPARGIARVTLGPVAEPTNRGRARVVIADGTLAANDTFNLALTPNPAIAVLLVSQESETNFFLRQSLEIASDRGFELLRRTPQGVRPTDLAGQSLVIVHDGVLPQRLENAVASYISSGGALWLILGPNSSSRNWLNESEWTAGRWAGPADEVPPRGVSLATVAYQHRLFQLFEGSDQGDLSRARFFRYRPITPHDSSSVLARFSDGAPALVERIWATGGRLLLSAAPFDTRWTTLPLEPVFLPLVHQTVYAMSAGENPPQWYSAGDVIPLGDVTTAAGLAGSESAEVIVEAPSGIRREITDTTAGLMPLDQAGFYEYYLLGRETASFPVAVNSDRSEFDLTRADPAEFVAAVTIPAESADSMATLAGPLSAADAERRQRGWWWLMALVMTSLLAESLLSNRVASGSRSAAKGVDGA